MVPPSQKFSQIFWLTQDTLVAAIRVLGFREKSLRMCAVAVRSVRVHFSSPASLPLGSCKVEKKICSLRPNHSVGGKLSATIARRLQPCQARPDDGDLPWFNFADDGEGFPGEDKHETFLERLARAWAILFPHKASPSSNASIAKQRLKMILISDRCSVNDDAKRRIVTNIVGALSDFVEIESEDKVQLNVTSDPDLGTVYSVTVPVRRVRPQYQEFSHELVNTELRTFDYEEQEGNFRMVDIRFEHPDVVPQDVAPDVFQDLPDSQDGETSDP